MEHFTNMNFRGVMRELVENHDASKEIFFWKEISRSGVEKVA